MGCMMSSKLMLGFLMCCVSTGIWGAQEEKKSEEKPAASSTEPAAPVHQVVISAEDAARKNPVKFTQASIDRGKKIYNTQCAMCHGANADGKGEMVEEMKLNPPDFTKPDTLKKRTDGEWFAIIGSGTASMPGQGNRMTDKHKWDLVNFLRAKGGKVPEKSTEKEPEENVILVPQ